MYIFEIVESEGHEVYQKLTVENQIRQYGLLKSVVEAAVAVGRPFLSQSVLKALNFHAITCLHICAGEYRPCQVEVGDHLPPPHYRVQALMDDFVNAVNRNWESMDAVVLASYVLWRLNHIHPFINGNGRTARAASYFVLCLKSGVWLPGTVTLPELITQSREEYCNALRHADTTYAARNLDLAPLHTLLSSLLAQQLASAVVLNPAAPVPSAEPAAAD
ncbi:MAG: Fic family protein [Lysobacter sp.]|nr:Fic family protein [Lysobacter sp.]